MNDIENIEVPNMPKICKKHIKKQVKYLTRISGVNPDLMNKDPKKIITNEKERLK